MLAIFRWNCGEEQVLDVLGANRLHEVMVLRPILSPFEASGFLSPDEVSHAKVLFSWKGLEAQLPQNGPFVPVFEVLSGEEPWVGLAIRRARLLRELDECEREIARGRKNAELRNAAEIGQG